MAKRIAILGTVNSHRLLAPFHDDEWEIWVCSPGNAYGAMPRVTRWFELHGVVDVKNPMNAGWNKQYFDWLNTQTFPVYMQEPNDLIPQARIFPIKRWLKELGHRGRINATSSISLMIGYAMMEGAEEIGIWGVDMADSSEAYSNQKSGCLNLLCMASERGIKVTIPLESCLGTNPPLYGYAEASRAGMRMMVQEDLVKGIIADAEAKMNAEERRLYTARGALDQIQYFRRTFVDGEFDSMLDVEETSLDLGDGAKAEVVHSKGTVVVATRIPELNLNGGEEFELGTRGVMIPKGWFGNSGREHRAEE